jgi:streptomycin 6-kinase
VLDPRDDRPVDADLVLPAMLPAKARALGAVGESWLSDLPHLVRDVAARWDLGDLVAFEGGTEAFVAMARRSDGSQAVLKVGLPGDGFATEVGTLLRARGNGYVQVLAHEPDLHAILLEPLGRSLDRSGLAPAEQIALLCRLLPSAWAVPRPVAGGHLLDKAARLAASIEAMWAALDGPAPLTVRDQALAYAERRGRSFSADRSVVLHGDAASSNALAVLSPRAGAGTGFVFVDPDGFVGDPAYDVGVALRDWCGELAAERDARGLLRRWCRLAADLSGLDAQEVWEWAFVERVSTGLYCLELGAEEVGRPFLDAAVALLD